jgi:DnaJ family protein C protein 19
LNYNGRYHGFATADLHSFALRRTDDDDDNKRYYHTTAPSERAAAMMMGLASVSALAYAGSSAVQSYNEWKAAQPSPEESEKMEQAEAEERAKQEAQRKTEEKEAPPKQKQAPRENVFKQWFGVGVGSKYYEGGFEDTMTKREAALILGVRESSPAQRIKDAHRKLLILNHPDTGGSTYLSGKLNEAKELLLKGKGRVKT